MTKARTITSFCGQTILVTGICAANPAFGVTWSNLDPTLEAIWQKERHSGEITNSVIKGLPKTKITGLPFSLEMSGFYRLPGSLPIIGDIGYIWPIFMTMVAEALAIDLDFMSYNQSTPEGLACGSGLLILSSW